MENHSESELIAAHLETNAAPAPPIVAIEQLFDEDFVFAKAERLESLSEFFYGDLGPFLPGRVEMRERWGFLRTQRYFDRTATSYGCTVTPLKRYTSNELLLTKRRVFLSIGTRE